MAAASTPAYSTTKAVRRNHHGTLRPIIPKQYMVAPSQGTTKRSNRPRGVYLDVPRSRMLPHVRNRVPLLQERAIGARPGALDHARLI